MKKDDYWYEKPKLQASQDLFHLAQSHIDIAAVSHLPIDFPFLKDFMIGLLPTDLLLVGARTGAGKSQLLTEFALKWSALGKRVAFIALEAEPEEIEQRIIFKLLMKEYFKDQNRDKGVFVDFRRWRLGKLSHILDKYTDLIYETFKQETRNLYTHYMSKESFTTIDLVDIMDEVTANSDVCIIDHLHYFDMMGSESEIAQMKQLMKRIRSMNLQSKIPFVLAAHLRKDLQKIMPGLEDFMGSSDISKIATSAILIAPKPDGYNPKTGTATTLISVPKLRGGGGTHLIGELEFSVTYQQYLQTYSLCKQSPKGDKLYELERENYPKWAKTPEKQFEVTYDF